jgi:hypothetical protein
MSFPGEIIGVRAWRSDAGIIGSATVRGDGDRHGSPALAGSVLTPPLGSGVHGVVDNRRLVSTTTCPTHVQYLAGVPCVTAARHEPVRKSSDIDAPSAMRCPCVALAQDNPSTSTYAESAS